MLNLTYSLQGCRIRLRIPEKRVFVPNFVGLFNATQIRPRPGETVADVGTGAGLHAILCAKLGARQVFGIDVSADAVRAARRNARLNGVSDRCRFLRGSFEDQLPRLPRRPDLIISTLPSTPGESRLMREPAMRAAPLVSRFLNGGRGGAELSIALVDAARRCLAPGGRLHLHLVAWSDSSSTLAALRTCGFQMRPLARADIPSWGQRCNAVTALLERARGCPWTVRYEELPRRRGCGVRVVEARLGRPSRAGAPRTAEVVVEVSP
ncbi:MAG: 50S ribosomal protein L11 methyltransferase [Elusimicrobia bacterium]|nr:50S ribosomal protein L11 methyltransferase [Elusimicrobiota bacterium]